MSFAQRNHLPSQRFSDTGPLTLPLRFRAVNWQATIQLPLTETGQGSQAFEVLQSRLAPAERIQGMCQGQLHGGPAKTRNSPQWNFLHPTLLWSQTLNLHACGFLRGTTFH